MYSKESFELILEAEKECQDIFKKLEDIALHNQKKVLDAFKNANMQLSYIASSTGYGNDDMAKGKLAEIYASAFGGETGIVSPLITSGTHALTIALFGVLRPDDVMYSITGKPYDTLLGVIFGEGNGSLKDFKVKYEDTELVDNDFNIPEILKKVKSLKPKIVYIQRSRGYALRNALSIAQIERVIKEVKQVTNA